MCNQVMLLYCAFSQVKSSQLVTFSSQYIFYIILCFALAFCLFSMGGDSVHVCVDVCGNVFTSVFVRDTGTQQGKKGRLEREGAREREN